MKLIDFALSRREGWSKTSLKGRNSSRQMVILIATNLEKSWHHGLTFRPIAPSPSPIPNKHRSVLAEHDLVCSGTIPKIAHMCVEWTRWSCWPNTWPCYFWYSSWTHHFVFVEHVCVCECCCAWYHKIQWISYNQSLRHHYTSDLQSTHLGFLMNDLSLSGWILEF